MKSKLKRLAGRILMTFPIAVACGGPAGESSAQEANGPGSLEARAGWVHRVMPGGHGPGGRLSVQIAMPATSRGRVVAGASYARASESDVVCCGPNPGYTYQLESVSAEVGNEWPVAGIGGASLAFDARYTPTWYHEIRRGHQDDFQPSPTEWHTAWLAGSLGLTARRPIFQRLQVLLGARADFNLGSSVFRRVPVPLLGFSLGVTW